MKKTPLHRQHELLGARMGAFGGWDMPIQYAGILEEHHQTRTQASVFDICHMGEFQLSGPTALQDLERLLTCSVSSMAIGQVRYAYLLQADGGTLDDLTCYRSADDSFMLVVNAGPSEGDRAWIESKLSKATVFSDCSAEMAKLDVQGPKSRDVLEDVLGCMLPDLGYFRFKELETPEGSCILSRTGYTGEWGYEIYLPNHSVEHLWERLIGHPACQPGGLGARDTLRLEMGYPLYGHELTNRRTPVSASHGKFIDRSKDFIGKNGVEVDLAEPKVRLVGLQFASRRAARSHDRVFCGDAEVGEVSSGSVAPSLGVAVAMAFVAPHCAEVGSTLEVEIRGKCFPAEVVELPFYKNATARG